MGAAVEVFDGSRALAVDRSRFRPVKTTNELLLIRSDLYRLTEDSHGRVDDRPRGAVRRPRRSPTRTSTGSRQRLPARGALDPRLLEPASSRRDATFGAGVVCTGDVRVTGGVRTIPDGAHLEGEV